MNSWVERFRDDLDQITDMAPGLLQERGAVAVSGGPDSLALLWLVRETLGRRVDIITVDHGLRPDSAREAREVARVAHHFGMHHHLIKVDWPDGAPESDVQNEARQARYKAIEQWAEAHGFAWFMTAHHADDQAETVVMRLVRGSGLAGLSGIRAMRPAGPAMVVRPLLGWRKSELEALCAEIGIEAMRDPSNHDPRHDRTRVRQMLAHPDMPGPEGMAKTARRLADAEAALDWAVNEVIRSRCERSRDGDDAVMLLDVDGLPDEIVRRVLVAAAAEFGVAVRGQAAHRAMRDAQAGTVVSLGGLLLRPGDRWSLGAGTARAKATSRDTKED